MASYVIRGPLTYELAQKDSPIRKFFDDRLMPGLKDAQAAYRAGAGPLLVPGVPREVADAGTIGTAADWMLRMLVHPTPSLRLAARGAAMCEMLPTLRELAFELGYRDSGTETFPGPARGSGVEAELLYRACWALALLTEVYRRGVEIAMTGPIGRLADRSARSLLDAAPAAGLEQLAALRDVTQSMLLPAVASRQGLWAIGPAFAGAVPQEPGLVKLGWPGQARAVVEGEPGRVADVARQRVQAEQRRDSRPVPAFLTDAPDGTLNLGVRRDLQPPRDRDHGGR
jgi:hypothetical protein